ncbi:MAG: hypothetical protein JRN67_00265, partial [Nitrososphaerota archaeon]|nr:hypothetical protein [Nitrososphaerota archaeon]
LSNVSKVSEIRTEVPKGLEEAMETSLQIYGKDAGRITFNAAMQPPTFEGGFWVNGNLNSGSTLTLEINLENSQGQSVTGYGVTLGPYSQSQSYNQYVPIQGIYPSSIPSGSYKLEFVMTINGVADFGALSSSDSYFIQPEAFQILNETAYEPFITDSIYNVPYQNWWDTYIGGPLNTHSLSLNSNTGLKIDLSSNTAGTEADYGLMSYTSYSFATHPLALTAETSSSSVSGSWACVALSPEIPSASGYLSNNLDYITACQDGSILSVQTSSGGTVTGYSTSISSHNVSISLELTPGGSLDLQYNTGSGPTEFPSFPISVNVGGWQSKSVYAFDYQTTTSTTAGISSSTSISLQIGSP